MLNVDVFKERGRFQNIAGVWFVALIAFVAVYVCEQPAVKSLSLNPLLVSLLIGLFYGNTISQYFPNVLSHGVRYCSRQVLRLAIILLGFSFTFQQIANVGPAGLFADLVIVFGTLFLGYFVGTRVLKMERGLAIVCSIGPAICGASAIIAAESVLRTHYAKTAVAVSTVALFGTISMFLYPVIYKSFPHGLSDMAFGIYVGATIHEVPQVVAAGNLINQQVAETSIIIKMGRVLMLVPVLFLLNIVWKKIRPEAPSTERRDQSGTTPWWAFIFVAAVALNSTIDVPKEIYLSLRELDIFFFTMAMAAIGIETTVARFKEIGGKPFLLAFILFIWLILSGLILSSFA